MESPVEVETEGKVEDDDDDTKILGPGKIQGLAKGDTEARAVLNAVAAIKAFL